MAADNLHVLTGTGARMLVERMGLTASNFLASLASDQRAKALFCFANQEERTRWYYTPAHRAGLPLSEMERHQQRMAHRLVATGLSRAGYVAASTIMGLEATLDALEGWSRAGRGRDPTLYYVSIFGEPSAKDPWGWRFEGHHISLNYTIVDGRIISPTPTFFGSNPADVEIGCTALLRPLAGVEDLARELVHTLSEEQRLSAVISPTAPADIVAGNRPMVFERGLAPTQEHPEALRLTSAPKGLPASAMDAAQREILTALIREVIGRMPDEIAETEMKKLQRRGLHEVHFLWAGGLERRQPHYYRLQALQFLVEYDNTQNDANHIHSVWRDPANDFGAGLLAGHYTRSHHGR